MSLNFQFDSFASFIAMAGHGPYVWAAYAISVISLILIVLQARIKRRQIAQKVALAKLRASQLAETHQS